MRAIDADALRDRLQNLGYDDWNQGTTTTWAEAFNECADMVDEQPTIEPQRKRGKWIVHPGGKFVGFPYVHYECDQCRDFEPEERNFCPNCGADMREDGEVEEPKKCDTCKHEKERWFSRCADCSDYELWESKE